MRENKERDMTPFSIGERPKRQSLALLPVVWAASWLMTRSGGLRVEKKGMEGLQPPFLVLSEHQGFTDYYIAPLALFPHRASYVSDMEGFAAFGKKLYAMVGCIPTRRFVPGSKLIRAIRHVVEQNRDIIVIYPEARHSNVGTNTTLPPSIGKLVGLLGLPVVVLKTHGSYLTAPIWDESHRRKVPLSATLELVLTAEQARKTPHREITDLLNDKFRYDEYRWQAEQRVAIDYPKRAEGLHKVLYRCPACGAERMTSQDTRLCCLHCGKQWEMDVYGRLGAVDGGTEFPHIPDWYEFQRRQVEEQINEGRYALDIPVKVEALPNEKGFVPMGGGRLEQLPEGFRLALESGAEMHFSALAMTSVHTEYDYKGRGDCVVLSTQDCCYYCYPLADGVNMTKIQFAAEQYHKRALKVREDAAK